MYRGQKEMGMLLLRKEFGRIIRLYVYIQVPEEQYSGFPSLEVEYGLTQWW